MPDLSVTLSGWKLDNPLIPASGTFGYGEEYKDFYDLNVLGSFSCKGTTPEPRHGNPQPRIAESESGMLNSVGLQNPGIHYVVEKVLPNMHRYFRKPIIVNIGGNSVDDFVYSAGLLDAFDNVGIIEVNISCPNLHDGGVNFASKAESAAEVTRAVKAATKKPVYMKLSPNVSSIAEIARACEKAGADGISLINTIMGMRINLRTRRPVLANTAGGLSGRAVLPVALWMVYQVYEAVDIPIMGMGGVFNAWSVIEMMLAGATAVQIGAENLRNPFVCKEILDEMPSVMEQLGIERLADMTGAAHPHKKA